MVTRSQTGKSMLISEILTHKTVGLIEKGLLFPGEMLVCDWNLLYLEVNETCKWFYSGYMHNSHILEYINVYNWNYSKFSLEKLHLSWLVSTFFEKNLCPN